MITPERVRDLMLELRTIQAWERLAKGILTIDNREAQKRRRAEIVGELSAVTCSNPESFRLCPVLRATLKSQGNSCIGPKAPASPVDVPS